MKTINKIIGILLLAGIWGCDSWLDVKPSDRVSEDKVFESEHGFYSALNGVYIELIKPELYGATLSCEMIELMGQRYTVKPDNTNYRDVVEFKYNEDYPKGRLQNLWNAAYKLILDCNMILKNTETRREVLSDQGYAVIKGEVLALRAFLHFDLLRLFGPVYKTKASASSIPYVEQMGVSVSELMPADSLIQHKLLRDLQEAERLLYSADPVVTVGLQMKEQDDNTYAFRGLRLNYYAVLALQARVYMYIDDKENALRYARMVTDASERETYFPFSSYQEILGNAGYPDYVFSSDMLFGLYNTDRNDLYKSYFDQENASTNLLVPRVGTIEALYGGEEADWRYSLWKSSIVPGDKSLICNRFKKTSDSYFFENLMPLIRVSEMFLIAAECCTDPDEAYGYLNTLRNHRGLVNVSDKLATHLDHEYSKEFLCEGQLFFYYKRKNAPAVISGITGKSVTMTEAAYVPALPDSEIKYRN